MIDENKLVLYLMRTGFLYCRYVVDDRLHIVMEFADAGTIHDYIKSSEDKLTEDRIWELFVQMVDAIRYLHEDKVSGALVLALS